MSSCSLSLLGQFFLHLNLFGTQALNRILCVDFTPSVSHICVRNPSLRNSLLLSCDSFLRLLWLSGGPLCHSCMKFLNAVIIFVRIYSYNESKINLWAKECTQSSLSKQGDSRSHRRRRKKLWLDDATSLKSQLRSLLYWPNAAVQFRQPSNSVTRV